MNQELDIKDLIFSLWRRKYIILIITICSFIMCFLLFGINIGKINSNNTNNRNFKLYRK